MLLRQIRQWQCAIKGHVCTIKIMSPWPRLPDNFNYLLVNFGLSLEQHYRQIWERLFR